MYGEEESHRKIEELNARVELQDEKIKELERNATTPKHYARSSNRSIFLDGKRDQNAFEVYFLISSSLASYYVKKGENDREIYGSSSFLNSQDCYILVYFVFLNYMACNIFD